MVEAYTMLQKALTSGRPVVLGRTSCGAEACLSVAAIQRHDLSHICGDIHGMSGIYPDTLLERHRFVRIYKDAISALDGGDGILDISCSAHSDSIILEKWAPHVQHFDWLNVGFIAAESIRSSAICETAWTRVMEGRTVLVVHPFIHTIRCQLARQRYVHACKNVLPMNASFKLVQMSQALALRPHASYNETLHFTFSQIDRAGDFDMAIIGAGAYGMPIAAYVKQAKRRVAVVLGGLSQTLFGIEGGRWAKHDKFASEVAFQNWTYPLQADVPATSRPVGDVINGVGAYWGPGALTPKVCPLATGS